MPVCDQRGMSSGLSPGGNERDDPSWVDKVTVTENGITTECLILIPMERALFVERLFEDSSALLIGDKWFYLELKLLKFEKAYTQWVYSLFQYFRLGLTIKITKNEFLKQNCSFLFMKLNLERV